MNRSVSSFPVLVWLLLAASAQARDLKTMHDENNLPRPVGVVIAGAQPDQVVLYCTSVSAGCKGMREHLRKINLGYLDKDPKTDPVAGAEFDALGGQGVPLVVFKNRLMHSYYPTSFDRLYAQYHTDSALAPVTRPTPSPVSAKNTTTASPALESLAPSSQRGAMVEDIAPDALKAYVDSHPNVAVLYTSSDTRCPPCVASQLPFEQAAASGLSVIRYVRVQWSPWWETPTVVKPLYNKAYLPAITVYRQGKAIAHQGGVLDAAHLNAFMEKRFGFAP